MIPSKIKTVMQTLYDMPHAERRQLLDLLSERQNHRCCWCGRHFSGHHPDPASVTFEHIHPRAYGGDDRESNLVAACHDCNQKRGGMHYLGFLAWTRAGDQTMATLPEWIRAAADELESWYERTWSFQMRQRMATRLARLDWYRAIDGKRPLDRLAWLAAMRESCLEESGHGYRDPFRHEYLLDPYDVLARASEMQRHHCAICAARIDGKPCRPNGPYFLAIDRDRAWRYRHEDNVLAVCGSCKQWVPEAQLPAWIERETLKLGSLEPRRIAELRELEDWLRDSFNSRAKQRVWLAWKQDLAERAAAGHEPKPWLTFLSDFRSACNELGLTA